MWFDRNGQPISEDWWLQLRARDRVVRRDNAAHTGTAAVTPQCDGGASSGIAAGQRGCSRPEDQITQIYEGTNQVQRIVMARQLLAGVQSEL